MPLMPLYLYIPFYFTKFATFIGIKLGAIDPNDTKTPYYKHFCGNGFVEPNFLMFMSDIRKNYELTYWLLIICPNTAFISSMCLLILLII